MSTTKKQALVFLFVGGLNTLFGYSLYALLIYFGVYYPLAVLLATCLGVLFNFFTTGKIVFKNSNNRLLIKFIGVYAFLYVLNVIIINVLHALSDNLYLAGFIATFPLAVIAFVLNKFLVFKGSHEVN